MKAKKMLALLLSGAMALTIGVMSACDPGNNNSGGGNTDDGGGGGGGGNYTVDTTEYYLVGDGGGDLKQNGWSNTNHVLAMKRDETADHNLFNITIDMYEKDVFQIVHDDSWDGQMGISYFQDVEEDETLGQVVKNDAGEVVFVGTGMFKVDITLQEGHDGTYTFSLHTFPDGEKDAYITYTKDGDLDPLPPEADMYVVTDKNELGWMPDFSESGYHMTQSGNVWTYILTIEEDECTRNADGDVIADLPAEQDEVEGPAVKYTAVAVRNEVNNQVICDSNREPTWVDDEGYEYNLLPAGVYTLKYKVAEKTLTITEGAFALYFIGSFNGWNQDVVDEDKLIENEDGTWTGYLTITEDDYVEGKNFAEVKLFDPLGNGWYSANGDSNMELTAGTYFFKFTPAGEETAAKVEYEECAYYVVGSFTNEEGQGDDNFNFKLKIGTSVKLENIEDGVVYGDVEFPDVSSAYSWVAPGVFALKIVYGTYLGGARDWYGDGDNNVLVPAEGEYTVSMNLETHEITLTETVSEVKVSFDLNYPEGVEGPEGQVAPATQTIAKRATAVEPTEELTLDGYTFHGWYIDAECTEPFDFETPVTKDIILYARWVADTEEGSAKITFNWNDGTGKTEVVETVNGLIGENMPAKPERAGYYFLGWYTKSSGGSLFDFETAIELDTNVFAQWQEIDMHDYWLVGTINGWNSSDKTILMTKQEGANIYVITIKLFEGAEFKIIGDPSYNPEYGSGNLLAGNSEGLGGSGNIKVTKTGMFTITLHTAPVYKISTVYAEVSVDNDIYFQVDGVEGAKLNPDQNDDWTGSITVQAGQVVKLIDKNNPGMTYDVNITEAGEYFVKLTVATSVVVFEKFGYYLAGEGALEGIVWGIGENSPKMTWDESAGVYKIDVEVPAGGLTFKVVYGTLLNGVRDWLNSATSNNLWSWSGDNLKISTAGSYTITINPTNKSITIAQKAA